MRVGPIMRDEAHDIHMMGGTALLTPQGRVLYRHVTTESYDRPTAEEVLQAIRDHSPSL